MMTTMIAFFSFDILNNIIDIQYKNQFYFLKKHDIINKFLTR